MSEVSADGRHLEALVDEDDDVVDYPDPEDVDVDDTPGDEGDDTIHGSTGGAA